MFFIMQLLMLDDMAAAWGATWEAGAGAGAAAGAGAGSWTRATGCSSIPISGLSSAALADTAAVSEADTSAGGWARRVPSSRCVRHHERESKLPLSGPRFPAKALDAIVTPSPAYPLPRSRRTDALLGDRIQHAL